MAEDALTVAKEITLAVLPRVALTGEPEPAGETAGKVFKAVLKEVVKGIEEVRPKGAPRTRTEQRE